MNTSVEILPEQQQFPAVDAAYDFVQPSYQLMTNRFEAADTRLTTLLTMASSLALGVPLFARSVNEAVSYTSLFFLAAMVFSVLAVVIGVVGRNQGTYRALQPRRVVRPGPHGVTVGVQKERRLLRRAAFRGEQAGHRRQGAMSELHDNRYATECRGVCCVDYHV